MREFSASPQEMIASLWRNRDLIKVSAKREVLGRYRGSMMGIFWSFFNPVLMLLVFTFVFSVIFEARWQTDSDSKTEFALVLFAGLIVFNLFAECFNRAPTLILSNVNYVKKVVYPLEILPCVTIVSAMFHCFVSLSAWLLVYIVFFGVPNYTIIYIPLILFPFFLFIIGLSWALASLGVFLRDISQFIGVFTTLLMFLSPIFFPATAMPEDYRYLLYINPLTPVIELTRDVLFWGSSPDFLMLGIYWFSSFIFAWIGFAWFQKTRKGFADVL